MTEIKVLCKPFPTPYIQNAITTLMSKNPTAYGIDRFKAVFDKTKLWDRDITIGFIDWNNNSAEDWRKAWVKYIIKTKLQPYVGIRLNFKESNPEKCDIRVTFDPELGSYSRIGTDSTIKSGSKYNESLNLGWIDAPVNKKFRIDERDYTIPSDAKDLEGGGGTDGGTVVHEFCHSLGMIHEHQSPFKNPLKWNEDQILKIFEGYPNYWSEETIRENVIFHFENKGNVYNGSQFDPLSIMKYSFKPGMKLLDRDQYDSDESFIKAVRSIEKTNTELSILDKFWLQYNYPGGEAPKVKPPGNSEIFDEPVTLWERIKLFFYKLTIWNVILILILIILIYKWITLLFTR